MNTSLKTLLFSFALFTSIASAQTIVIDSTNIESLRGQQTDWYIGASAENPIWALDFGSSYGPSTRKVEWGATYSLSTSVMAQYDILKVTSGQYYDEYTGEGSGFANAMLIIDQAYTMNVLYSNGNYNYEAGIASTTTVSNEGDVLGFAIAFKADKDGAFQKLTVTEQDLNMNGISFVLDLSSAFKPYTTISGTYDLITADMGFNWNIEMANNVYYTLDGVTYDILVEGEYGWGGFETELEDGSCFKLIREGNTMSVYYEVNFVPEPSTYAAIFGVLALAFVAYKRRK